MKKAEILTGVLHGLLPFVVAVVVLGILSPGGSYYGAQAFALNLMFWAFAIGALLLASIYHFASSLWLAKLGRKSASASVWLAYPLVIALALGWFAYHEGRIWLAMQWDYSSRELIRPSQPTRHLLLVTGKKQVEKCEWVCASALKTGALDSFAVPAGSSRGGFIIYRLGRGKACVEADRDAVNRYTEAADLQRFGYFDQCITNSVGQTYDYDVKVNFGASFRRSYGPCCNIAEIYENGGGKPELIARWEADSRDLSRGRPFGLEHVIGKLTGRKVPGRLPSYPVENLESELARLVSLPAWALHSSDGSPRTTLWLIRIIAAEASRFGEPAILSNNSIEYLLRLAPVGDPKARAEFFEDIDGYSHRMSAVTFRRLQKAEAKYQASKQ